jgi:L-rhamnose-H+ transport protein
MTTIAATGFAIILLAGLLQGLFALPMKFARGWNYENIWLIFAATGLVIFPWMLTAATVPHLPSVYRATPTPVLLAILGFGLCWGIGATLTGLGVRMLGIGLGLAIILGLSASVGSLIPLLVLTPEKIHTYQGHIYVAGTAIMLAGIALGARAGFLRERETAAAMQAEERAGRGSFLAGLAVVTASGLLSSSLNFCYAFGGAAMDQARAHGSSPLWSSNVITALATTGGFFANLAYCVFLLRRNSTAGRFWSTTLRKNWIYGAVMGAFWFGGQALYGLGISRIGDFGTVLGWPLLMGMIIITSNLAGFLTGEWAGTGRTSRGYLALGMTLIICALGVLALGHAK